jgi:hypothetical protein
MLIVLVSLVVCVLVVAALVGLMFVDVAFKNPQAAALPLAGARNWRPPLLLGQRLREWAAQVAEANTARKIRNRRDAAAALELVGELHEGATRAIDQPWQKIQPDAAVACPGHHHSMTAVTAPEAILAADYLKRLHPEQISRVRAQALENAKRTAGMDHVEYRAAAVRCPLMSADNACLAYGVRPLRCRAGCDLSADGKTGCAMDRLSGGSSGAGGPGGPAAMDAAEYESRAQLVTEGAEIGFSRALESAGLDGQLYDLNVALVAALDAPHAAESWIQGERIFDNCRKYR